MYFKAVSIVAVFAVFTLLGVTSYQDDPTFEERLTKCESNNEALEKEVKTLKDSNSILKIEIVTINTKYNKLRVDHDDLVRMHKEAAARIQKVSFHRVEYVDEKPNGKGRDIGHVFEMLNWGYQIVRLNLPDKSGTSHGFSMVFPGLDESIDGNRRVIAAWCIKIE